MLRGYARVLLIYIRCWVDSRPQIALGKCRDRQFQAITETINRFVSEQRKQKIRTPAARVLFVRGQFFPAKKARG